MKIFYKYIQQVILQVFPGSYLSLVLSLKFPLFCQLFPGGQVVSAVLQHRGQLGHKLGQQVVAGQADTTEETNLGRGGVRDECDDTRCIDDSNNAH